MSHEALVPPKSCRFTHDSPGQWLQMMLPALSENTPGFGGHHPRREVPNSHPCPCRTPAYPAVWEMQTSSELSNTGGLLGGERGRSCRLLELQTRPGEHGREA